MSSIAPRTGVLLLAIVALACTPEEPETTCDPSAGGCSSGYVCCSDDPAALDLSDDFTHISEFVTPMYVGGGGRGTPLFSGLNNAFSKRGMCVKEGEVGEDRDLDGAPGCPIPCNPHWDDGDVLSVCGPDALCCRHVELEANDCVLDDALGCVRPVTGNDVLDGGVTPPTNWSALAHSTHQDPGPTAADGACRSFIDSVPGAPADTLFNECIRRLTVADARAFCVELEGVVKACPAAGDACQAFAAEQGLPACG
jgi:hypothetical protein